LMVDFHGSSRIRTGVHRFDPRRLGGKPLDDLRKGLDAALPAPPVEDGDACARSAPPTAATWSTGSRARGPIASAASSPTTGTRREDGLLRHRRAVVPRVGARWHSVGFPGGLRRAQPIDLVKNWKTPTWSSTRARLPRRRDPGPVHLHRAPATRHSQQAAPLPDENHWCSASQQHPVARDCSRVARPLAEEGGIAAETGSSSPTRFPGARIRRNDNRKARKISRRTSEDTVLRR